MHLRPAGSACIASIFTVHTTLPAAVAAAPESPTRIVVTVVFMLQVMLSWAAMGYRVMGVVCGKASVSSKQDLAKLSLANIKDNMRDVRLLGFMVISNPVRGESGCTIAELQKK